ncbi:MAG TPA: hypothetical protein VFS43_38520 [Polyangiaceae bacterium]|nr:hypothetical protein [Polyangiaceae bacterium]
MKSTYAEGPSYEITLEGGLVTCRIWSRPDLDWAAGASAAEALSEALVALAAGPRAQARGLLVDERQAPSVVGPRTQAALGALLSTWERRGRHIAFVLPPDPVVTLQKRRLMAQWAPKQGRVFESIDEARAWALAPDPAAPTPAKSGAR